ncbi:MAG: S8 family serine peptidase [Candidatus Cyclonatronum sp.]|uniref:S8 family serine peptidase n=1 Tax=Cyclonatronum sp. TaxID=3024185 RepID=UPI0025C3A810|nr:S8 family serine peptidase [Cyclonatronum sp.]MCH8486376.1 S8 family serine peptidase [Cyclonatronum sp.]
MKKYKQATVSFITAVSALLLLMLQFGAAAVWAQGDAASPGAEQQIERAYISGIGEIEFFSNELVVEFAPGVLSADVAMLQEQLGVASVTELTLINAEHWTFRNGNVQQALDMLNSRADVVYAEPNFAYRIPDVIRDYSFDETIERLQTTPNDPGFNQLWGLHNTGQSGGTPGADISALQAWGITTGSSDLIVAVFDSGIRSTHPDLVDNLWFDSNGNPGASFLGDTPEDLNGHGTHVAGTIGAVGNNAVGVTGVNWNVSLMNIKICGLNGANTCNGAAIVQGLQYALENGAVMSNHSWGGPNFSQAAFNAINAAGQAGHFVIAAAGNNGSNNDNQNFYPAGYNLPNVMAVASSTRTDQRSGFSNFGANTVHVAAPGSEILSTYINSSGYATLSGTSMASPHAAGLAALIKSVEPGLSPQQIRTRIMENVDPVPAFANNTIAGGRINAFSSLQQSQGPVISTSAPSFSFSVQAGSSATQNFTVSNTGSENLQVNLSATFGSARAFDDEGILIAATDSIVSSEPDTYGLTLNAGLTEGSEPMSDVLGVNPASLNIAPGNTATVTISLNAASLTSGSYSGSIVLSSNAVNNPNLSLPVSISVSPEGEQLVLWQQNRSGTGGIVSGTFEGINTAVYSSDDFQISQTAVLGSISTVGFQNNQNFIEDILMGYQLFIFEDDSGAPSGSPAINGSWLYAIEVPASDGRLSVDQDANNYTITLDVSSLNWALEPGRYWLAAAPVQNMSSLDGSSRWNWAQGEQNFGEPQLIDPDNNFGAGAVNWTPLSQLGINWNPAGLTFTITGTPGSGTPAPAISVSPSELNFAVQSGSSANKNMTVTNTGSGTLEVSLTTAFGSARAFDEQGNLIAFANSVDDTPNGSGERQLTAAVSSASQLMSDVLGVNPATLSLEAGSSATVTVSLNAGSLSAGNYTGNITLVSNAVNSPELNVPVSVTISPEGEEIVLFDQSGNNITSGILAIYDLDGPETWAVEAADDFNIPAGQTWSITTVEAFGFYGDLNNEPAFVNVYFYADTGGRPADTPVTGFFEAAVTSSANGTILVQLPEPVQLESGTWWVSVSPHMDYFGDGRWLWFGNESANGAQFHWRNPGGGYGIADQWTPRDGTFPNFPVQDLAFKVIGTLGGTPGPGDPDFTTVIAVSDAGSNSVNLTIGTAADATDGFDPQYDLFAPPPGPAGTFDARISFEDEDYFTFFRPTTTDQTVWPVQVRPSSGNAPVTLSWNPASLAEEGFFLLSGSGVNVNMREQNTVQVEGSGFRALTITHSLSAETEVSYLAGWNLVGMAFDMPHDNYAEVFTGALANTLFGFDGTYTLRETLDMGDGYWLRYSEAATEVFTGMPEGNISVELRESWNLISGHGGCDGPCGITDPAGIIIPGTLFGFDGSYFQADALDTGKGYWVRTDAAGSIGIGAAAANAAPLSVSPEGLDAYAVLRFSTPQGASRELLMGAETAERTHPLQYTLPPLPPVGAFDVRFSGDYWLTDETSAIAELRTGSEPAELSFTAGHANAGLEAVLLREGEIISTHWLEDGTSLMLGAEVTEVQLTLAATTSVPDETPAEFALKQNYPNPFNPNTLIEYALPEAADVRLEVFNLTGQLVAVLVNGQQAAGRHSVSFDAGRLSSGMYIYRLQAGSFVQTRKMMLLK